MPLPAAPQIVMRQLLEALREVHSHGIIHMDVKPLNIIYDSNNGILRLLDFGLAFHPEMDAGLPTVRGCKLSLHGFARLLQYSTTNELSKLKWARYNVAWSTSTHLLPTNMQPS